MENLTREYAAFVSAISHRHHRERLITHRKELNTVIISGCETRYRQS